MSTKRERTLRDGLQSISGKSGFAGLLSKTEPEQEQEQPNSSGGEASAPVYGRLCAVVNIELQRKLQEIAHRHSLTFKQVLEEAMKKAVTAYEEKNGEIKLTDGVQESSSLF